MPSGAVSVVESLAPDFETRPADQAAAGSQIPEPHKEPRRGGVLEYRGWL